jgi:hypothetical protein
MRTVTVRSIWLRRGNTIPMLPHKFCGLIQRGVVYAGFVIWGAVLLGLFLELFLWRLTQLHLVHSIPK